MSFSHLLSRIHRHRQRRSNAPASFRVPGQWPLVSSDTSVASANDKSDNEVKQGAVHRSPGIYLKAEENPGKPQLKVIASNGVPISPNDVGRFTQHLREEEGEGRKGKGPST